MLSRQLNPEGVWYLKKIIEFIEKDYAEDVTYTQEQVKEIIKVRRHRSKVISAEESLHHHRPQIENMFMN